MEPTAVIAYANIRDLKQLVKDENENQIMTWHALGHWEENIVFGAKIES